MTAAAAGWVFVGAGVVVLAIFGAAVGAHLLRAQAVRAGLPWVAATWWVRARWLNMAAYWSAGAWGVFGLVLALGAR